MRDRETTYAEDLRSKPRSALTRAERAQLDDEDAWAAAHPSEVARLDAFVGQRVVLRKEHRTLAGKVVLANTSFHVFMRTKDRLLARDSRLDEVWLLRDEWLRIVPARETAADGVESPTSEPGDRQLLGGLAADRA